MRNSKNLKKHITIEFENALDLLKVLDQEFPGTQSLIVGGAVRDKFLGIDSDDVDIATNIPFTELEKKFSLNDITKTTVNAQPVSIIVHNGCAYEIAAFRTDSFGVEGRANNEARIVNSFAEDTARRDITINAIGMNSREEFIDPEGGLRDLSLGVIRCVGIPAFRFREDATRILRVLRFAAKFAFEIEERTAATVKANHWRLADRDQISPESISKELFKAASSGHQLRRFINLLFEHNCIQHVLPELEALEGFTHDPQHHPEGGSTVIGHILECLLASDSKDPVVNLAILFHDLGKAVTRGIKENGHSNYHGHEGAGVPIVQGIFDRLRFPDLSADDKDKILFAVEKHMLMHDLNGLSRKTQVKLVHNPGWNVLKEVGIADEVSRDALNYNIGPKLNTIREVETKVANIAPTADALRLKVKAFVDGHKVQEWFPEVKSNLKLLTPILEHCAEYILNKLDQGHTPTEEEIQEEISVVLTNPFR